MVSAARETYENHPSQGQVIITSILSAWKTSLGAGGIWRMSKNRTKGFLSCKKRLNLPYPESVRHGVFCGWNYVVVHCPYCDKWKLVSAKTHKKALVCEKCKRGYNYYLDLDKEKGKLVRYKGLARIEA